MKLLDSNLFKPMLTFGYASDVYVTVHTPYFQIDMTFPQSDYLTQDMYPTLIRDICFMTKVQLNETN